MVDWEYLAPGVWALRGLPEGKPFGTKTLWTTVVVQQGDTAKLLLGERIDELPKAQMLLSSLAAHGFTRAYAVRNGVIRWYHLPKP